MKPKLLIVHSGTQHAWQLANAAALSQRFRSVELYTGFLLKKSAVLSKIPLFKCREREIHQGVTIHNSWITEIFKLVTLRCWKFFGYTNHNPDYLWQLFFNLQLLLPVFIKRKNCFLILFETGGWPLSRYANRWKIPLIIDFPAISHEFAIALGIPETRLGIYLKLKERQFADYAFFCSEKAAATYKDRLILKTYFIHYPGTREVKPLATELNPDHDLNIAFIGNTAFRKGLDILLSSFSRLAPGKKLFIIGALPKKWVVNYCRENGIGMQDILFTGKLAGDRLLDFLKSNQIQLHVLPSRCDSFAAVVPETMKMGIVNIISSNVGYGELLTPDEDVLLLNNLDPDCLLALINRYRGLDRISKYRLSYNGRRQALKMGHDNYYRSVILSIARITTNF